MIFRRDRPRWKDRIDEVPGENGEDHDKIRVCYTVEPVDVERSKWRWHVWLEFQRPWAPDDWCISLLGYEGGLGIKSGPHDVGGDCPRQDIAEQRAREAVDDVRRRIAAGEALRTARAVAGRTEVLEF